MKRRFWIAVAAGALLGGGAVLGFAPYVRAQLDDRAGKYGADVTVAQVMPALAGIRLHGVSVTLRDVPGVRVWIDDLVVGWRDRRPVSMSGGTISAVGPLAELAESGEKWQRDHAGHHDAPSGGAKSSFALAGFALDWRSAPGEAAEHVHADGLTISQGDGKVTVAADSVAAELAPIAAKDGDSAAPLKVAIEGGRVVMSRGESGMRIHELASRALRIDYRSDLAPPPPPAPPAPSSETVAAPAPARVPESARVLARVAAGAKVAAKDSRARTAARSDGVHPEAREPAAASPRVIAARRLYRALAIVAARIDQVVAADAQVDIRGARARMVVRGQELELGPGTFELGHEPGALVLSLSPDLAESRAHGKGGPDPLTFSAHVPLAGASAPLWAELRGGPVWLSQLGLKDGDFGLADVSHASLESDARVELSADGATLDVDGGGKLHKLALKNPRLAQGTVEGIELAWRGKARVELDGSDLKLSDTELDLGGLKLLLDGRYQRDAPRHAVDLSFEVPLTNCQTAFDSLPKALVPKLAGMRLAGSLGAKGHARFEVIEASAPYALPLFDVDWDGALSCRVIEAPAEVAVANFKKPFRKVVYTPEGEERFMTFGPGSDNWAPYGSIARFMETGVLTCEDGRFERHHGFDKEAIINSIRENLAAGFFKRGASTISMQLAKNLYLTREKTLSRKLQEAVLTLYLEQQLTKPEMIELYLNVIEYGPMVYGIGAAAQHYFHTSASSLSLGQSLYLASILQNPKKQYFGPGGVVGAGRMSYLHRLMKLANKIHLVSDEELEIGLRETVVFGQPEPTLAPKSEDDPYADAIQLDGI